MTARMDQFDELPRLGMSKRKIAASLGMSATAAGECIRRAQHGQGSPAAAGLGVEHADSIEEWRATLPE